MRKQDIAKWVRARQKCRTGNAERNCRFIAGIIARHGFPTRSVRRPLELIFRRSTPTILLQAIHRNGDLVYAPRWSIVLSRGRRPTVNGDSPNSLSCLPLLVEQFRIRTSRLQERFVSTERIVRHVLGRCDRIEVWPQPQKAETAAGRRDITQPGIRALRNTNAGGPAALVVRRPPAPDPAKITSVAPRPVGPQETRTFPNAAFRARPESSEIDLRRLTDQVIQAIDRRIVAQRERTGRV